MKFIKLTNDLDKILYINAEQITGIAREEGYTVIRYTNSLTDFVKETPEEIMEMIKEEKNER